MLSTKRRKDAVEHDTTAEDVRVVASFVFNIVSAADVVLCRAKGSFSYNVLPVSIFLLLMSW